MKEIRDDAVVLRTYKSGESDRVVVLWTRHHGKVRVLAKGIRKTTSRLGGNLETLAYVNVDLVKTRGDFYIARHVAHRERLTTLRASYARINAGYAVVEVMDAIPSDDVADEDIFDLLTPRAPHPRRRDLRPDAGAVLLLLQAPGPGRLGTGRRRLRQLRTRRPARRLRRRGGRHAVRRLSLAARRSRRPRWRSSDAS